MRRSARFSAIMPRIARWTSSASARLSSAGSLAMNSTDSSMGRPPSHSRSTRSARTVGMSASSRAHRALSFLPLFSRTASWLSSAPTRVSSRWKRQRGRTDGRRSGPAGTASPTRAPRRAPGPVPRLWFSNRRPRTRGTCLPLFARRLAAPGVRSGRRPAASSRPWLTSSGRGSGAPGRGLGARRPRSSPRRPGSALPRKRARAL